MLLQPRIKPVRNPQRIAPDKIRVGGIQYGVGAEIDDEDGSIWMIMGLMDGSRTVDAIVADALASRPFLSESDVRDAVAALVSTGIAEDAAATWPVGLSAPEARRYSRNANFFTWIDTEPRETRFDLQVRLKNSRVTILGLGGSGSSLAMSLVAAGVGNVHCVDFDRVEDSNLSRQLLYTEEDIGQPKVATAVRRLRKLNKHANITGEDLQVTSAEDLLHLMPGPDLFVLCADQPAKLIQDWSNTVALLTGTSWILSLYTGPMVVVGTFVPYETPCWQCIMHAEEQRDTHHGNAPRLIDYEPQVSAAIAPVAGLTAHFGALEVIYFLAGLCPQTVGRIFHQNMMAFHHLYYIEAGRWSDCPACGGGRRSGRVGRGPGR